MHATTPYGSYEHPRLDRALVDELTGQRVAETGEEVKTVGAERDVVGQRVAPGLAVLAGDELGQFVGVRTDAIGDLP